MDLPDNNDDGFFGFVRNFTDNTGKTVNRGISSVANLFSTSSLEGSNSAPSITGGRRRKSRRARKGKRSKTARRRKSRGKHALPTSHPLHEQTRRLAMGQARAKSLALAGGVRAYSSNELSSMQPAYVNSKQGSFLLAGGKTKKYRKGKKAKKGGQFWA
jgi:hypothetical protein